VLLKLHLLDGNEMQTLKPAPIFAPPPTRLCPVCGRSSYSRDGIHPQCSMLQADSKRTLRPRKKPVKGNRFGLPKNGAATAKPMHSFRGGGRKSA
jgi:hypothetical protein